MRFLSTSRPASRLLLVVVMALGTAAGVVAPTPGDDASAAPVRPAQTDGNGAETCPGGVCVTRGGEGGGPGAGPGARAGIVNTFCRPSDPPCEREYNADGSCFRWVNRGYTPTRTGRWRLTGNSQYLCSIAPAADADSVVDQIEIPERVVRLRPDGISTAGLTGLPLQIDVPRSGPGGVEDEPNVLLESRGEFIGSGEVTLRPQFDAAPGPRACGADENDQAIQLRSRSYDLRVVRLRDGAGRNLRDSPAEAVSGPTIVADPADPSKQVYRWTVELERAGTYVMGLVACWSATVVIGGTPVTVPGGGGLSVARGQWIVVDPSAPPGIDRIAYPVIEKRSVITGS